MVALLDGVAGGFDVFEFDVAESVARVSLWFLSFYLPYEVGGEEY